MRIGIPRYLIVAMAGLFAGYHVVLGLYDLGRAQSAGPVIVSMVLYAAAIVASLVPARDLRMPLWLGAFNLAVSITLPLLVSAVLDPNRPGGNGYATWYVAGIGTLLTITVIRLRPVFAWLGIVFLVAQSVIWAGPESIVTMGVGGSLTWVAVAYILSRAMAKATKDARRFALAEREATDWQAAQEAHVFERQFRLGQTSSMALAMLRQIEKSDGELTDEQRRECLHLEGAIRDEIRGRRLLNDDVREQVMAARRRGAVVSLLDEGGLDDLSDREHARVLNRLADALRGTDANKLIARTVPEGTDVAITVVGLRSAVDVADDGDLLQDNDEDEVVLWLEIRRGGY
ncbi:hypothetical protein BH11ACT2_BH11ACT2_04430 [soil metagenome]